MATNRKTYYIDPCTECGQSSGFYQQKLTRKEAEQLKKKTPATLSPILTKKCCTLFKIERRKRHATLKKSTQPFLLRAA